MRRPSFIAALLLAALLLAGPAALRADADNPQPPAEPPTEEQWKQLGEELNRFILKNLKKFLDKEISHLKKKLPPSPEEIKREMADAEEKIRQNPGDAESYLRLADLNDQLENGIQAILHAKKAEDLYIRSRDAAGAAQARKQLRQYYQKYDYRPEDFIIPERTSYF